MLKTVDNKNTVDVQNIMTIELNTASITAKDAILNSWNIEIEDEGKKYGTTLDELKSFINAMTYVLHNVNHNDPFAVPVMYSHKTIMCHIYTHELSSVFHWLRNIFNDNMTVFTNTWMSPITADININNVVFILHDTYRLVPKTLEEWKSDEDLSGNIVLNGMKKYREKYSFLYNIPVSQAGEVRRECKSRITDKEWLEQTKATISSYDLSTYRDLVSCFIGGTLGVNQSYKDILLHNIYSDDLSSAYPGVMATRKFPVSPWEDSDYKKDENYRYYLVVKFKNVKAKGQNKFYPFKKCDDGIDQKEDGIALDSAKEVTLTMTDIDFEIFKSTYTYSSYEILKCRRSRAAYLPKQFVRLILKYYGQKTTLKGTNEVSKYRQSKIYNNCFYGVAVTKTITDDIVFEKGEWKKHEIKTEEDFNKKRDELLKSKQFISYQIGVWVTAYVRAIMWSIIPKIDEHVIYFDTDCIKHNNKTDIFKQVNEEIKKAIQLASIHHDIDIKNFMPKNKPIGCFEEEALSYDFKAIDVKRYAKRTDDGVEAMISGMPKDHINLKNVKDLSNHMHWEPEESGRFNIYYNDGKSYNVSKMPAPFTMNDYNDFDIIRILCGMDISNNKTKMFRSL